MTALWIGVKDPTFSTTIGIIYYSLKRKFNYYIEYNNVEKKKVKTEGKSKYNIKIINAVKNFGMTIFSIK